MRRLFVGLVLGFACGWLLAYPMLVYFGELVIGVIRALGVIGNPSNPQFLALFSIVYAMLAACYVRAMKITRNDSLSIGFMLSFPIASLCVLVVFATR